MLDLKKSPLKNGSKLRGQGGGKERRVEPRFPVAAMAEAIDIKSHTRIGGRISDIGVGGCYFEVMSPFGAGAELQVRITRNEQTVTTSARVLYSTGGMGMGLLFTKVDPEQRQLLQRWVSELSGKPVASIHAAESESSERARANAGEAGLAPGALAQASASTDLFHEPPPAAEKSGLNEDARNVVSELITLLMRNRVLTDTEGKNLLRKLMA
jgi:hypothetical protein